MANGIQAVLGRIQEIEAKLSVFNAPDLPRTAAPFATIAPAPITPFPVMLAQAKGDIKLRAMGAQAGPFEPRIEALITKNAVANGLDADVVRAVVQQESSGNPRDVSGAGAQGLMQLMPETSRMYGVTDPFDPEQNIAAGTRHLANLMREFGNSLPVALAAYNAGSGAVRRAGGIPNFPETRDYVRRITEMIDHAKGR